MKLSPIVKNSFVLLFILAVSGCSSTQLLRSWKNDEATIRAFEDDHIVVVARTSYEYTRKALEDALVEELQKMKVNAVPSYLAYPELATNRELSDDERIALEKHVEEEGYNGIFITTIKGTEREVMEKEEEIYVGATHINNYPEYYQVLYNYYYQPYWTSAYYQKNVYYQDQSEDVLTTTQVEDISVTYILESVGYDLSDAEQEKLVFVVRSSVKDPKSIHKGAKDYARFIVKQL